MLPGAGVGEIDTAKVEAEGNIDILKHMNQPLYGFTGGGLVVVKQERKTTLYKGPDLLTN